MGRCKISKLKTLLVKAEARGYQRGAHVERDRIRGQEKHVGKTKRNQDATLDRYVLWHLAEMTKKCNDEGLSAPREEEAPARVLYVGAPAPDLAEIKDFLRFYAATSRPKLADVPTVDSLNTIAEWFFAGFTRVTQTSIQESDRSEVYTWVRQTMTEEGIVVSKHIAKHNFEPYELVQTLTTLWTKDDLSLISERYRAQFTFILRVFCWTGARIGSFFDDHVLKWRDVTLVLQQVPTAPWRLIFKIDQRWVKGNRDPDNVVFGAVGLEHKVFMYDDAAFLLTFAILDKALYGYETLRDLRAQTIPEGDDELELRFHESALDKPILRKCTKSDGISQQTMPQSAFTNILKRTLTNAGYTKIPTVHAIRRELGKKVDKLYTAAQRSQHLTQADVNVFGASYLARTSAVDGLHAFLGEPVELNHITYFQGSRQFREVGLPCKLPAAVEHRIKAERLPPKEHQKRRKEELRKHQDVWQQARNKDKINTRGKLTSKADDRTTLYCANVASLKLTVYRILS